MSYDEHKEARLELAEARAEIDEWKARAENAESSLLQQVEFREDAEAEVRRLREWSDSLTLRIPESYDTDDDQETIINRWIGDVVRERDALRAQLEAVRALADADALERWINSRFGTDSVHRLVAEAVAGLIEESALSSSEPVTAGPEDDECVDCGGTGRTGSSWEGPDFKDEPCGCACDWPCTHDDHLLAAGEVTPPAEQRTDHHPKCYQSRGVPQDLPSDICDCKTLWMLEALQTPSGWTCPTKCVELNHPGREHEQWMAEYAAGEVTPPAEQRAEDERECCASGSCEVCRPGRGGWIGWGEPARPTTEGGQP